MYYKPVKISSEIVFTFWTCYNNFKNNIAITVGTETLLSYIIHQGTSFLNRYICPLGG